LRVAVILSLIFTAILSKDVYYFAPLALEKAENNIRHYEMIVNYLSKKTGLDIQIRYYSIYDELLEAFESGEADFGHLGPLPFIVLTESYPYIEPVAAFRNNKKELGYRCCIIARSDSFFTNRESLKDAKKIALTQPLSTCGHFMSADILKRNGLDIETIEYSYTGSHSNSALSVILGEYDIGGLKCDIADKYLFHGLSIVDRSVTISEL